MRPALARISAAVAIIVGSSWALGGCSSDKSGKAANSEAVIVRSFAGPVEGTDAYLAVLSAGSTTLAYLCDGANGATWFAGTATSDKLMIQSKKGDRLELRAEQSKAVGTLVLDGTERAVALDGVATPSGLYVLEPHLPQDTLKTYLGGWIVLPDGSVKGAVKSRDAVVANPPLNLKASSVPLPSGQTVAVVPFAGGGGGGGGGFQLQFQFGQFGSSGGAQIGQFGQFGGGQFSQFGGQFGQFGGQIGGGQFGQLGGQLGQFQG